MLEQDTWRDVTEECDLGLGNTFPSEGSGHYIALWHKGKWLLELGLNKVNFNPDMARLGYKIEPTCPSLTLGWFKVLKKE